MSEGIAGVENLAEVKPRPYFSDALMQSHLLTAHGVVSKMADEVNTENGISERYRALVFVRVALGQMMKAPSIFDSSCDYNIRMIGSVFADHLQRVGSIENHDINTLFAGCYRFVVELELKSDNGLSDGLSSAWNDIAGLHFSEFSLASEQIRWAKAHMIFSIMREYIQHPDMVSLKKLPAAIKSSDEAIFKSNEDLSQREERVNALADKLKGYENAYNFVGLYQGFSNLKDDKVGERESTFKFLIFLGVCLVLMPFLKLVGVIGHNDNLIKEAFSFGALFAFELIVIYFFRIALQNYRSIKAQLLQIDLRMTLCQFINSYVEFASDARKSDKELLNKFEQIIFSGIVTEDSGIPSTFDGLEQVAKIVESLKPR